MHVLWRHRVLATERLDRVRVLSHGFGQADIDLNGTGPKSMGSMEEARLLNFE